LGGAGIGLDNKGSAKPVDTACVGERDRLVFPYRLFTGLGHS
jgi:hypothetical protein